MKHETDINNEICEECTEHGNAVCDFCQSILCEEHAKRVPGYKMLIACEYCMEQTGQSAAVVTQVAA